jgi:hypothetical protein
MDAVKDDSNRAADSRQGPAHDGLQHALPLPVVKQEHAQPLHQTADAVDHGHQGTGSAPRGAGDRKPGQYTMPQQPLQQQQQPSQESLQPVWGDGGSSQQPIVLYSDSDADAQPQQAAPRQGQAAHLALSDEHGDQLRTNDLAQDATLAPALPCGDDEPLSARRHHAVQPSPRYMPYSTDDAGEDDDIQVS